MMPITIKRWDEVKKAYSHLSSTGKRWVFRGQKDAGCALRPSLERVLDRFGKPPAELRKYENRLLREFKRHFHRYSLYTPSDDANIEWLTLMQHHGAPTRLLDWTYSFYVALFFAVESAELTSTCGIWAVDIDFLIHRLKSRFSADEKRLHAENDKHPKILSKLLDDDAEEIVSTNPLILNERLAVQQGAFLICQSRTKHFHEVFDQISRGNHDSFEMLQIKCSSDLLTTALDELYTMNITRVSLFPGLDGFSQSFANLVALEKHWAALT